MVDSTGESDRSALRFGFDHRLLLQFRDSTITSDAGLLAYRELDDALHLTDMAANRLADAHTGKNGRQKCPIIWRMSGQTFSNTLLDGQSHRVLSHCYR